MTPKRVRFLAANAALLLLASLAKGCGGGSPISPTPPAPAVARRWLGPQLIGNGEISSDFEAGTFAQLEMDTSGNALAVWPESSGSRRVRATRFVPGRGWSSPEIIDAGGGQRPYEVSAAMVPSGQALVVWPQSDRTRIRIWANRFDPNRGWGAAETIDGGGSDAAGPDAAISGPNEGWAVWSTQDAIWARHLSAGAWAEPVRIGLDASGLGVLSPRVAVAPSGAAVALWRQLYAGRRGAVQVWATSFLASRGWATPLAISAIPWDLERPQVVMDGSGSAVAIWREFLAILTLKSSRFAPETGWVDSQQIPTDITVQAARLVPGPGGALATWLDIRGLGDNLPRSSHLSFSRYGTSTGWSPAQTVALPTISRKVDVATDARGNAMFAWNQSALPTGGPYAVWARRLGADGVWEATPARLQGADAWDASSSVAPRVRFTPSGDAIAVWQEFEGLQFRIWANRYAAAP